MQRIQKTTIILAGAVGVFALAFWLAQFASENGAFAELVMRFGYSGAFIVSLVSGFNLIVPVPAVSFLPLFLEAGLNLWIVLPIMVLGITIADSLAYFIGLSGHVLMKHLSRTNSFDIVRRLTVLRTRWRSGPLIALFVFASLAPFPNEVLVIPLGLMGYHLRFLLPVLLLGNSVFHLIAAAGILGFWSAL